MAGAAYLIDTIAFSLLSNYATFENVFLAMVALPSVVGGLIDKPIIAVVKISDAFEHFWSELAEDIDAVVCLPDPDKPEQIPASAALVVLAAGGSEVLLRHSFGSRKSLPVRF